MSDRPDRSSWLADSLKEETEEALDGRDFEAFAGQVLKKIELEVEASLAEPFALAHPLREAIIEEIDSREVHWSAFTQGVLREVQEEARAESKQPLVERAVAELNRSVETELERVEPQFERRFQRELLERLSSPMPSLFERLSAKLNTYMGGWRNGVGLLGAATAIFLLIIAAPRMEQPPEKMLVPPVDRGSMVVKEVSFEGRVMVIEGDGVTFVYLSDS